MGPVWLHLATGTSFVADGLPGRVAAMVDVGSHLESRSGVRGSEEVDDDLWPLRGRPRRFIDMRLQSRRPMQFHFDLAGGNLHTVTAKPVRSASLASSNFHNPLQ
jgi:hypothetical protein